MNTDPRSHYLPYLFMYAYSVLTPDVPVKLLQKMFSELLRI